MSNTNPNTYRITIAYDGTNFHGWQIQPNAVTIQQVIEEALALLLQTKVRLIAAGRTDAGVHAIGQIAHFRIDRTLDVLHLFRALNGVLPKEIRILECTKAHPNFHANRSAIKKIYHYNISFLPYVMPLERFNTLHYQKRVDFDRLVQAAALFVGKHDFTAYANVNGSACIENNPYRTIFRLEVVPTTCGVRLEFEGDGFFYKMVRNITGMILAVASGRRTLEDITTVFESRNRRLAEKASSASGLTLVKVFYPEEYLVDPIDNDDALLLPE